MQGVAMWQISKVPSAGWRALGGTVRLRRGKTLPGLSSPSGRVALWAVTEGAGVRALVQVLVQVC